MNKIFVIGDIHGMREEALSLIYKLPFEKDDLLIFLGDYIDRGYDSKGVIDFLLKFKKEHKNVIFLMGNHEDMLLSYMNGTFNEKYYFFNGGEATLKSYNIPSYQYLYTEKYIPRIHLDFLRSLKLYYETDKYLFIHAGLRPGIPLPEQNREDLLWIRDEFIYSNYNFGKIIIFGHTTFLEGPLIMEDKIGIDTGLVYGGRLTSLSLPDMKFYTQGHIDDSVKFV